MKRWYEEMTSSETHITSDEINEGAPIISSDPTPSEEVTQPHRPQTQELIRDPFRWMLQNGGLKI